VNALTGIFLAEKFIYEIRNNQKNSLQTFAAKVRESLTWDQIGGS
jgi:hypothetical protein